MIVNDIFKSYLSGMSINEIAEHLNTIYPKEIANGIPERFMQSCVMRNILETACTKKPTQRIHSH